MNINLIIYLEFISQSISTLFCQIWVECFIFIHTPCTLPCIWNETGCKCRKLTQELDISCNPCFCIFRKILDKIQF